MCLSYRCLETKRKESQKKIQPILLIVAEPNLSACIMGEDLNKKKQKRKENVLEKMFFTIDSFPDRIGSCYNLKLPYL